MIDISSTLTDTLKYKDQTPIFRVEVYDTVNTVPSVGVSGYYYNNATHTSLVGGEDAPYWAQNDANLLFNWDNGVPLGFGTNLKIGDQYSVKWIGQFQAPKTGEYFFESATGQGHVDSDTRISVNSTILKRGQSLQLIRGAWYAVDLRYIKNISSKDGSVAFFYHQPGDLPDQKRLLSANVLSPSTSFVSATILSGVHSVEVERTANDAAMATINIENALNNSQYVWSNVTQSWGVLRQSRLVKIFMGYRTSTGEEVVQQFIGHIDNVVPKQTDKKISLTVNCRDFTKNLLETLVENFPNRGSYLLPIQFPQQWIKERVSAYDKWMIRDAIIDLCIKSNIDPSYLINKIETRLAYRLQWDLEAYPNPYVTDRISGEQEEHLYLYKFEYGSKVYDKLLELVDLIGFSFFFDAMGNVVFRDPRQTYRKEHYEDVPGQLFPEDSTNVVMKKNPWSWEEDSRTSTGSYTLLNPQLKVGSSMTFPFEGVGVSVVIVKRTDGDSHVGWVITQTEGGHHQMANGAIDASAAANSFQNEISLKTNLPFGKYKLTIGTNSSNRTLGVEGIIVNRADVFTPKYTFRTTEDIIDLGYRQENENIRNDITVVGTPPPDGGPIPYGRAVDLNSITDRGANNYIGKRAPFILKLPTIADPAHLQWMSEKVLTRYNRRHRSLDFSSVGVPHLEIGDPVGISGTRMNLNTAQNTTYDENALDLFWTESIKSVCSRSSYETTWGCTSYPPLASWRPPVPSPFVNIVNLNPTNPIDPYQIITPVSQVKASDILDKFSSLTITPSTIDPFDTTIKQTVKIQFSTSRLFQVLYVEIWSNDETKLYKQLQADGGGTATQLVGTIVRYWTLDWNQDANIIKDGTYKIFIYGQIVNNNGDEFPSSSVLFPEGRQNPPNKEYVWKPNGSIPTVTVASSSAKIGFALGWGAVTVAGGFGSTYSYSQNIVDLFVFMDKVYANLPRAGHRILSALFFLYGQTSFLPANMFNTAVDFEGTKTKCKDLIASYMGTIPGGDSNPIYPQIGGQFTYIAHSSRPGEAKLQAYRVRREGNSYKDVKLVWEEQRPMEFATNNNLSSLGSRYFHVFDWQSNVFNGESANPELYILTCQVFSQGSEAGIAMVVHKNT